MAVTILSRIKSFIITRGVFACLGVILGAIFGAFTVYANVRFLNDALTTPSALDPARSELAVCVPLVLWHVLGLPIGGANYLPDLLSDAIPSLAPSGRTRAVCMFMLLAWLTIGVVLLSTSRTCEAAAPFTWGIMRWEVLIEGSTALVVGVPLLLITMAVMVSTRVRARRAVVSEEADEKDVVVDTGQMGVVVDVKV